MKKQPNRPVPSAGAPCTSKSNGYTCALTGDHTEHSSKEKRSGQYITWEPVGDGKLKVTFHQGNSASSVIEDDPNLQREVAPAPAADPNIIELEDGTLYDRKSPLGPPVKLPESWTKPKKAEPVLDSEQKLVRAHRKKQAEARAEAKKAKQPKSAPEVRFCNEREPDNMRVCTLPPGHDGDHDSGVKTWPVASAEDRVYALIVANPGRDALEIGRTHRRYIKALEQAGRIEWRDEGWWPVEQSAAPAHKPMTLEDEPEDPEADAAAIAAMDEQKELDEEEPTVCGDRLPGVGACKLFTGHAGNHFTEANGVAHAWDRDGDNSWDVCGVRLSLCHGDKGPKKLPKDVQTVCQRPEEHDGDHRGLNHIGNHADEWKGNGPGCTSHPKTKIDFVAELLGRGSLDHPDDEEPGNISTVSAHTEALQPQAAPVESAPAAREYSEPDHVETEPSTPGFALDPAPNPGDTRTVEGRHERWVWAPEGGWGWRAYTGKGKGCAGCGRHKVDCLCKEMKAAPSSADWNVLGDKREPRLTDICAKCGSEVGEHNGKKCPRKAKPPKAVAATADAPAVEPAPSDEAVDAHIAKLFASPMMILGYPRHPAAAIWPMMEGEDFQAVVDGIKNPPEGDSAEVEVWLVVIDGKTWLIDGSNRGRACEIAGVTPVFKYYTGPTDMQSLREWVDIRNDRRRHCSKSVRAMIAAAGDRLCRGNPGDRQTGRSAGLKTQAERAKAKGVSERLVRRAEVVQDNATPAVVEAVMRDKMAVDAAVKVARLPAAEQDKIAAEALARKSGQMKAGRVIALAKQEEKRAIVRKINEQRVAPMPAGPFGVIYGDYPWLYENSDQHEGSRGHMGYPPMTMEEILAHAREASKRAAKDCVLALWVTNAHLVNGNIAKVVEAYGATPHSLFTWPKPRAGVGTWGRGQTEHLVIASIGNPVHTLNEVSTLLESYQPHVVGEHSSKPEEVADLLAKHCAGPHLELFARADRGGTWACWGAEVDKFASEAA